MAGFGGFSGATQLESEDASALPPALAVELRRLSKRDSTTKLKALAALSTYAGACEAEEAALLLQPWLLAHARLATDTARGVRAGAAKLSGALATRARRGAAPHGRALITLLWPARFDDEAEVAATAAAAFEAAFPGPKAQTALAFAAGALREAALQALALRTPAELPEPAPATAEEGVERLSRVHATALRTLAALPAALGGAAVAGQEALEAAAAAAEEHGWLARFTSSPEGSVRAAAAELLGVLAPLPVAAAKAAPHALHLALSERAPAALAPALAAAVALARGCASGAAWRAAAGREQGGTRGLTERLAALFRSAFNATPAASCRFALPLFALAPEGDAPGAGEGGLNLVDPVTCTLLDALWDAHSAVPSSDAAGRAALAEAYADCVTFATLRAGASASSRGADPAPVQSALLHRSLTERPLVALLGKATNAREVDALAACICRVLGTLAGKASCASGVLPGFWASTATAVADAVRLNDGSVERGTALLKAAQSCAVGDTLARLLVPLLLEDSSSQGSRRLLASAVKLHGLGIATALSDGGPSLVDSVLAACSADGSCDAGQAELLAAALTSGDEARWEAVLSVVAPLGFANLAVLLTAVRRHGEFMDSTWQHHLLSSAVNAAAEAVGSEQGADAAALLSVALRGFVSPPAFELLAATLARVIAPPSPAAAAAKAIPPGITALQHNMEPGLVSALFARALLAQPADVDSDSELDDAAPLHGVDDAAAQQATAAWLTVADCIPRLPEREIAALAAACGDAVRSHIAASTTLTAGRAAAKALTAAFCGEPLHVAVDSALASGAGWPAHVSASAERAMEQPPSSWPLRCVRLATALVDSAGPDVLLRKPWLAAELLCSGVDLPPAATDNGPFCAAVAQLLLQGCAGSTTQPPAAAARRALCRLLASCSLPVDAATSLLHACLPSGAGVLSLSQAELAEAVMPALAKHLRSSGPAGSSAAEAAALEAASRALELLRRRGAEAEAHAALALRCAAAAFPVADLVAGKHVMAVLHASAAEVEALLSLWSAISTAHAAGAAAAAAQRRAGGLASAPASGWSAADAGVAALCVPLVQCAWPRLKREDWVLLLAHLRRWAAAASPGAPSSRGTCSLLALMEALPVTVAEPLASGAGGDVVPFSAAGASSSTLASELAAAGWPQERGAVYASLLAWLFEAGSACLREGSLPAQPFWLQFSQTCASSPQGAILAAANAADAAGSPGAVACLYALLRSADSSDTAPLALAAFALLTGDALRHAGVLGLDCLVSDCDRVLLLADKAAAAADENPIVASAPSSALAIAEAACLREPLAALLAMPGPPQLLPWALLLRALLLLPEAPAERLAAFVRDSGRLPALLDACLPAVQLPSRRVARGDSLPPAAAAAWVAAADPAATLAAAPSLPAAALAAALLGAALRGCPSECRAWFTDLRDAGRAALLEAAVGAYLSPALVEAELAAAAKLGGASGGPGLSVRVARGQRLVTAAYALDDAALEVAVRLPAAYPLRVAEATCVRREGVAEARLRKWLLSIAAALRGGRGVAAALQLWAASCEKEFAGVEPCPICFSTLHASTRTLPRLACRQCRNCFHSACLYAWFQSSNKSSCPICQTPWGTVVR